MNIIDCFSKAVKENKQVKQLSGQNIKPPHKENREQLSGKNQLLS